MVTCPWCGTNYASFQPLCDNCGATLTRPAESTDLRGAQGVVYKPTGPVDVQFGNRTVVQGDLIVGTTGEAVKLELSPEARRLHRILVQRLDLEELRTLCFDLEVDYDSLGGEGKAARARQLLLYLQRREELGRLTAWIRQERPDIAL